MRKLSKIWRKFAKFHKPLEKEFHEIRKTFLEVLLKINVFCEIYYYKILRNNLKMCFAKIIVTAFSKTLQNMDKKLRNLVENVFRKINCWQNFAK